MNSKTFIITESKTNNSNYNDQKSIIINIGFAKSTKLNDKILVIMKPF